MKRSLSTITGVAILGIGVLASFLLIKFKPKAEKKIRPPVIPVVQCEPVSPSNHVARLHLMGTVVAAREITLRARVSGEIVETHANWIEGGRFKKGDIILRLDSSDYGLSAQLAEAALAQAQSELALEMGRQDIAKRELELINKHTGSGGGTSLALRVPQLKAAKAKVEAAKASLKQAKLNSDRTIVRAPFDAIVLAKSMDLGDQVSPQAALGTLAATDQYHVRASLAVDQLKWIKWPEGRNRGSIGSITLPDGSIRKGHVIRRLGDLEENGRMARLLLEIADPLAGDDPVLLGSYVSIALEGLTIQDAYLFSRDTVHEGDRIWLMTATNTLRIVDVERIFSERRSLYVKAGLNLKERLITSDLPAPVAGMKIRTERMKDGKKPDA